METAELSPIELEKLMATKLDGGEGRTGTVDEAIKGGCPYFRNLGDAALQEVVEVMKLLETVDFESPDNDELGNLIDSFLKKVEPNNVDKSPAHPMNESAAEPTITPKVTLTLPTQGKPVIANQPPEIAKEKIKPVTITTATYKKPIIQNVPEITHPVPQMAKTSNHNLPLAIKTPLIRHTQEHSVYLYDGQLPAAAEIETTAHPVKVEVASVVDIEPTTASTESEDQRSSALKEADSDYNLPKLPIQTIHSSGDLLSFETARESSVLEEHELPDLALEHPVLTDEYPSIKDWEQSGVDEVAFGALDQDPHAPDDNPDIIAFTPAYTEITIITSQLEASDGIAPDSPTEESTTSNKPTSFESLPLATVEGLPPTDQTEAFTYPEPLFDTFFETISLIEKDDDTFAKFIELEVAPMVDQLEHIKDLIEPALLKKLLVDVRTVGHKVEALDITANVAIHQLRKLVTAAVQQFNLQLRSTEEGTREDLTYALSRSRNQVKFNPKIQQDFLLGRLAIGFNNPAQLMQAA